MRLGMSHQPSETEDRPSISGDSEGCFVYIQGWWWGGTEHRRPTYPAETAATLGRQSGPGAAGLAETLAAGGGGNEVCAVQQRAGGFCAESQKGLLFRIRRGLRTGSFGASRQV